MKTLGETIKEYNGVRFIFVDEAKELCKIYSKKNRKKNNQIEYMLSDNEKQLYSITRDTHHGKPLWCGDFIVNVTTDEVLAEAKSLDISSEK